MSESLVCVTCRQEFPLGMFYKGRTACIPCHKAAVLERERRLRVEVQQDKLSKGCAICAYAEHPAALDYHHKEDTEKKFTVSQRMKNPKKVWKEIAKCVVLCAICHRRVHHDPEFKRSHIEILST